MTEITQVSTESVIVAIIIIIIVAVIVLDIITETKKFKAIKSQNKLLKKEIKCLQDNFKAYSTKLTMLEEQNKLLQQQLNNVKVEKMD